MPVNALSKNRNNTLVRQYSLQNQTTVKLSSKPRDKLKKQLSEDDSRCIDSVEITGQGWNNIDKGKTIITLKTGGLMDGGKSNCGKKLTGGGGGNKPKPAKMAWMDKKQDDDDYYPKGVEIVAKKCQGQPRPLSNKIQRFRTPLIGNKDTLVYSRLQLAERLRNAWSERDKTKPNLNIFLAQGSEQNDNNNINTPDIQSDNVSTLSDTTITKQMRPYSRDLFSPCLLQNKEIQISTLSLKKNDDDDNVETEECSKTEVKDEKTYGEKLAVSALQELNKIEIRVNNGKSPLLIDSCLDKENVIKNLINDECDENTEQPTGTALTAKERRGNYRNSSNSVLNKTITESFSLEVDKSKESNNENVKKNDPKKILVRALSAPNHDQKPNPVQKTVKFMPQKQLHSIGVYDPTEVSPDEIIAIRDRIKSAPIRRKLKSAAARRKNKAKPESSSSSSPSSSSSSSDEEKESKNGTCENKKTKKKRNNKKKNGNDNVITMVSLVSPAESDTEESVINLPMESTFSEEEKKETTMEIKSTKESQNVPDASLIVQKLISLRKANKSVSFQHHTTLTKNYLTSFPSRRAPAGTPIIIPSPVINNPALTPAQLQDRDKRPTVYYTGTDNRGTKRRLIRSPSEPTKECDNIYDGNEKTTTTTTTCSFEINNNNNNNYIKETNNNNMIKESDYYDNDRNKVNEPEFKNPKEKECWILYKKMIENGVTVTFDTVLRGMMTPTEYRLRKNPHQLKR